MSKISVEFKLNNVYIDVTSVVLSNSAGTIGVSRNDTGESVVNPGTAMTKTGTGKYEYEFTDPAYNLEYTYWMKWVYNGETYYKQNTVDGPLSNTLITVTSASLITWVRNKTQRTNETDLPDSEIEEYILETVREIAKDTQVLKETSSGTLTANNYSMTAPIDIIDDAIDDFYLDEVPQDKLTYDEWRQGYIPGYVFHDGNILVSPTPTQDVAYILYYRKEHPADISTILISDDFKMAVKYGTCMRVYERFDQHEEAELYSNKYKQEVADNTPCEAIICEQRRNSRM